jgi:hypothetical protein
VLAEVVAGVVAPAAIRGLGREGLLQIEACSRSRPGREACRRGGRRARLADAVAGSGGGGALGDRGGGAEEIEWRGEGRGREGENEYDMWGLRVLVGME